MFEKPPAESVDQQKERFVTTKARFREFADGLKEDEAQARARGDLAMAEQKNRDQNECRLALKALELGDANPARNVLISQLEANLNFLKQSIQRTGKPVEFPETGETTSETIHRIAGYLAEIQKDEKAA